MNGWEWVLLAALAAAAPLVARRWWRGSGTGERAWGCFAASGAGAWIALLVAVDVLVAPYWPAGPFWQVLAGVLLFVVLPAVVMLTMFVLAVKLLDKKEGL